MMQWVIRSIPHGGPIVFFHVPASALQVVGKIFSWYVLSYLWNNPYKRSLAAKLSGLFSGGSDFFSCCLSGPLPYVRHHITVNKMC